LSYEAESQFGFGKRPEGAVGDADFERVFEALSVEGFERFIEALDDFKDCSLESGVVFSLKERDCSFSIRLNLSDNIGQFLKNFNKLLFSLTLL
jgi:hypothetical protein